ncbi:GtrA family protein [Candidatus Saccharibacteria bacterium]|nr:GtrA family protein [Candidatus Saccharibacteria bacterium]
MQLAQVVQSIIGNKKVRYLLVGGTSALTEYGVFILLASVFSVGVVVANIISFLAGFFYTFIFHYLWTFKGDYEYGAKRQFIAYSTLAAINVVATSILIGVQVDIFHIPAFIAKLACMSLVVVWNYLLLNRVIFKRAAQ